MVEQTINPATLAFGEKFLEYLIAAEIVSRGTGPAKFTPDGRNNVPLIFDTCVLAEDQLPAIWRDKNIVAARELALLPENERGVSFEREYTAARIGVWQMYNGLYEEALAEAEKIKDPIAKMTRINDLNSLRIHFDYAGYNLGLCRERPTFSQACENTTGHMHVPTEKSLDDMAEELMTKLGGFGFEGDNLEQRMDALRESLEYVQEVDIVPTYERLMKGLVEKAAQVLGLDPDYFTLDVRGLPKERGNLASFEYQGNGSIRTSIKVKEKTHTMPGLILTAVHEVTHLLTSVLREIYFNKTGDKYSAVGTMCTAGVALEEGIGECGAEIFKEVVGELVGRNAWVVDIIKEHETLRKDASRYIGQYAHERLNDPNCDKTDLREELRKMFLKYGSPASLASSRSQKYCEDQNRHKALMYWPHYGEATKVVNGIFSRFASMPEAFMEFARAAKEKGPLTLNSFGYTFSRA